MPPVTRSQARLHGGLEAAELAASVAPAAAPGTLNARARARVNARARARAAAAAAAAAAALAASTERSKRMVKLLDGILSQYGVVTSLLSNMTATDYRNLRGVGIEILENPVNGPIAPALAQAWPHLGAHCDEGHWRREIDPASRKHPPTNNAANWHCSKDRRYTRVMKWCTRAEFTDHKGNFNMCQTCRERWRIVLDKKLNEGQTKRGHLQRHCEYHTKHLRRHWNEKYRYIPCICISLAQGEWLCRQCSLQYMKDVVNPAGSLLRSRLRRTEIVPVQSGSRVKWIRRRGRKRAIPGCPFKVSETNRCARAQLNEGNRELHAIHQCLNCDGFVNRVEWLWNHREYYPEDPQLPAGQQFSTTEDESESSDDSYVSSEEDL